MVVNDSVRGSDVCCNTTTDARKACMCVCVLVRVCEGTKANYNKKKNEQRIHEEALL